jgi:hypothetical protein
MASVKETGRIAVPIWDEGSTPRVILQRVCNPFILSVLKMGAFEECACRWNCWSCGGGLFEVEGGEFNIGYGST